MELEPLFVRGLADTETAKLRTIVRKGNGEVRTWQRAQILLYSAQGLEAPQIAPLAFSSEGSVHAVITRFNEQGIDALYSS